MRSFKTVFTLGVSLLLAACAVTTHFQSYPDLDALSKGTATMHFVRDNSPYGAAITAPVYIDRYLIGRIGPGGYVTTKVPVGKVHVTSTTADTVLVTQKDEHYFFEITMPLQIWSYAPDFNVKRVERKRAVEILGADPSETAK